VPPSNVDVDVVIDVDIDDSIGINSNGGMADEISTTTSSLLLLSHTPFT
jgi:hypothetical protein